MSVLAAFCETFVCVCVKGPEDENNLEKIDEVGVQQVFFEVTDFIGSMRQQSLSMGLYYTLYHRSLRRNQEKPRKREGKNAQQLFIKMQLGLRLDPRRDARFAHLKPLAQIKLPPFYISDLRFDTGFNYQHFQGGINTSACVNAHTLCAQFPCLDL